MTTKDDLIRCQFCGRDSKRREWHEDKCPHCRCEYDAILAQEGDD